MNKKSIFIVSMIAFLVIFISACGSSSNQNNEAHNNSNNEVGNTENNSNNTNNNADENEESSEDEKEDFKLTELLPEKKGYKWKYDGARDYGHEMELTSIDDSEENVMYHVEGNVEDLSGGESKKDPSIDVTYTVEKDELIQQVDSDMVMDNNFPEIELIREPLSEGEKWTQTQEDAEGEEITLESTIDSIEKDGEQKVYTVTYEDSDSEYYEKRKIKEGVGVIAFESSPTDKDDTPEEYEINNDSTGYIDNQKKDDDGEAEKGILSDYSDEEIEHARVWLEVIDNKDIDHLYVSHQSKGEDVNINDDDSVGYPEDVISLSGDAMADGVVTYSGNGDGTINLYDVPSHWPAPEQIDESMEEYTQDIIDHPEEVEIDAGDDDEVQEMAEKIEIED